MYKLFIYGIFHKAYSSLDGAIRAAKKHYKRMSEYGYQLSWDIYTYSYIDDERNAIFLENGTLINY